MNNKESNRNLYVAGGIIVGILVVLFLSSMTQFGSMMSWSTNPVSSYRATSVRLIDKHFIEQMIPHHEGAIEMAKLALIKSEHQEIKTLSEAIIEAQTKEIQDMGGWYTDWFGRSVLRGGDTMMGGGMMSGSGMHMGGQEDVTALENSTNFDKVFIEQMIPHHQLAIMMARMLRAGTDRPEMLQLADDIIVSQSKEITEMQIWYKSWYR